jgi:hypothetical protein
MRLKGLNVPIPCPIAPHAVTPAVPRVLTGATKAVRHIFRHVAHRAHRALHAAAAHTRSLVSAACHQIPGAFAVAALGVIAPSPSPEPSLVTVSPSGSPTQSAPMGSPGWTVPSAPVPMVTPAPADPGSTLVTPSLADPGSTLVMQPPGTISPPPSASQILPPYQAPAAQRGIALAASSLRGPASTTKAQPVPEPSSLFVLAAAICGLSLIRQRAVSRDPIAHRP